MKLTVGIFDDHPTVHFALESIIKDVNCRLIFIADGQKLLFEKLEEEQPEILILDVLAPDVAGLDVFKKVTKFYPNVKIIAYSSLASPILVDNLLKIGIKGFVNKKQTLDELGDAIRAVANNKTVIPKHLEFLTKKYRLEENELLTDRELEVLQLIADEMTTKEIAAQLRISPNTVDNHRKNIQTKFRVKNLAGIILLATRLGYIS